MPKKKKIKRSNFIDEKLNKKQLEELFELAKNEGMEWLEFACKVEDKIEELKDK